MSHGDDEGRRRRRAGGPRTRVWKMLLAAIAAVMVPILAAVVGLGWPSIGAAVGLAVLVATLEAIGLQIYATANADH